MLKAINIKWDTDGDKEVLNELPTEVTIPWNTEEEDICDYLSDEYGYCVFGFDCNAAFTCPVGNTAAANNVTANAVNFVCNFVFSFIFFPFQDYLFYLSTFVILVSFYLYFLVIFFFLLSYPFVLFHQMV